MEIISLYSLRILSSSEECSPSPYDFIKRKALMEIIISVSLGLWTVLAGVLCFAKYRKDFCSILDNKENSEEKRK